MPKFVPDQGCPDGGSWDPSKGQCLGLTRASKAAQVVPDALNSTAGAGSSPGKNSNGFILSLSLVTSIPVLLYVLL